MVMDRKTNINSLSIVWQGQSWSVIAPDGDVIARFKETREAVRYAESTIKHLKSNTRSNDEPVYEPVSTAATMDKAVVGMDGELLIEIPEKRKRDLAFNLTPVKNPGEHWLRYWYY
jgi:hypothetical protein